jgi:hypothetical protein
VARLVHESRHAPWRDLIDPVIRLGVLVSFSRVYLFLSINKWASKFVKLEMYDLQSAYVPF